MDTKRPSRRLAAVMLADLVGYSRMVAEDESDTLARVAAVMARIARPAVARHGGRLVKGTGDGFLAEFPSAVEAVACAAGIQAAMAEEARKTPPARRLQFRIGVNLGDIIAGEDGDIYGDGVNLAARLEPLAEPGGIAISAKVHAEVRGRLPLAWTDGGERLLKNIPEPVRVFLSAAAGAAPASAVARARIAVLPFAGPRAVAGGLAWLVAAAVARCPRLAVIPAAEAEAIALEPARGAEAAQRLGLRAVLEGEVAVTASGLAVSALLVDPRSREHLLAIREEVGAEQASSLPLRIAEAVARRANAAGLDRAEAPTRDPAAFAALLRGLGAATEDEAIAAFEEAAASDPGCALAQALLAHAFSLRTEVDPGAVRDAESLALRTLSLAPEDGRTLALAAASLARAGSAEAAAAARDAMPFAGADGEIRAILAAAGIPATA